MLKNQDIQIRDPFVLPDNREGKYYLYGSTDTNVWGKGTGFSVYVGTDLKHWQGPFPVFSPDRDFYSEENFWAPEVHPFRGKYYMFASFLRKDNKRRGTGILVADSPMGPFEPHSEGPVTPKDWDALDGTFFVDPREQPWMIFCREWVQVGDGEICAVRLSQNLKETLEKPRRLFSASEAPWTTPFYHPTKRSAQANYVTDGPFLFVSSSKKLMMLWSSFVNDKYALGVSHSLTGDVTGPWTHESSPLFKEDGGHGMLFKTFEGSLKLTLHCPNQTPMERPLFINVEEENGKIKRLDEQ